MCVHLTFSYCYWIVEPLYLLFLAIYKTINSKVVFIRRGKIEWNFRLGIGSYPNANSPRVDEPEKRSVSLIEQISIVPTIHRFDGVYIQVTHWRLVRQTLRLDPFHRSKVSSLFNLRKVGIPSGLLIVLLVLGYFIREATFSTVRDIFWSKFVCPMFQPWPTDNVRIDGMSHL